MIKAIQCGLGPIGNLVTRYLLEREGVEIVGAIDIDPDKVGKDVGELAGERAVGVEVSDDAEGVMANSGADAVILTTVSDLQVVRDQVLAILEHGLSVVSTCEELAYPWETDPAIGEEIDKAAKAAGAAVLGTGVNPGFLMDLLPVVFATVCRKVESVRVERAQDAAFRRLPFQRKIGAGLTQDEFRRKMQSGALRHVGLTESMHMVAAKLGWKLDRTEDIVEPVVAERRVATKDGAIEPGQCLGVSQIGLGMIGHRQAITLVFEAYVGHPEPRDRVLVQGDPEIDSTIKGGVNGDIATCAIVVNSLASLVNARPGLRTMADIEPPGFLR